MQCIGRRCAGEGRGPALRSDLADQRLRVRVRDGAAQDLLDAVEGASIVQCAAPDSIVSG